MCGPRLPAYTASLRAFGKRRGADEEMVNANLLRVGGIAGLLCVVVMIPAYLVGSPDLPASTEQANLYFGSELGRFVFSNGALPILHVFFLLIFLRALRGLLASAEGEGGGIGGHGPGRRG